jgi:hypothetical protein
VFPVTFYTGDDGEAQKYTQQAQKAALQMGFVLVSLVLFFYFGSSWRDCLGLLICCLLGDRFLFGI